MREISYKTFVAIEVSRILVKVCEEMDQVLFDFISAAISVAPKISTRSSVCIFCICKFTYLLTIILTLKSILCFLVIHEHLHAQSRKQLSHPMHAFLQEVKMVMLVFLIKFSHSILVSFLQSIVPYFCIFVLFSV